MENSLVTYALLCFTSFFTLTNPLGIMPVFLTMTQNFDEAERRRIVKKASFVAFLILVSFTIFGQFLFKFFGMSTNGFRIAGGIIMFKIGYDMLQAKFTRVKLAASEIRDYANDISITPLDIPMICGPGAIANGIVMMEDAVTAAHKLVLIGVIAIIFLITYVTLRASTRLIAILGDTGNNVMMRLMGLILMVIAIECLVSGVKPICIDIIQSAI